MAAAEVEVAFLAGGGAGRGESVEVVSYFIATRSAFGEQR